MLHEIAFQLKMTVVDVQTRMTLSEILDWVRYFVEKERMRKRAEIAARRKHNPYADVEVDPADMGRQSPDQIARMFGAEIVRA